MDKLRQRGTLTARSARGKITLDFNRRKFDIPSPEVCLLEFTAESIGRAHRADEGPVSRHRDVLITISRRKHDC
jgi:hypothetical protein